MSGAALLIFARCIGFAARAPGLSHPSVPAAVRIVIAIALTLAAAPGSARVRVPDGLLLIPALATETVIGLAIGAFASVLYDGAYAGGRLVDDYAGVRAIAPAVAIVAPSGFGRIWSLVFTGGFFLLGAYRIVIPSFVRSFALLPPGGLPATHTVLAYAIALPETITLVALAVAGPALALAFIAQIGLAALARTIPRFGNVTLASPFVFAAALVATAISVPMLASMVP